MTELIKRILLRKSYMKEKDLPRPALRMKMRSQWYAISDVYTKNDFQFTQITNQNVKQFPLIRKLYPDYKIQGLKHQGESPYGRKFFRAQFDDVIAQISGQPHDIGRDFCIAMHVSV